MLPASTTPPKRMGLSAPGRADYEMVRPSRSDPVGSFGLREGEEAGGSMDIAVLGIYLGSGNQRKAAGHITKTSAFAIAK